MKKEAIFILLTKNIIVIHIPMEIKLTVKVMIGRVPRIL